MISKEIKILWTISAALVFVGVVGVFSAMLVLFAYADYGLSIESVLQVDLSDDQLSQVLGATILNPVGMGLIGFILWIGGIALNVYLRKKYTVDGVYDVELEMAMARVERLRTRNRRLRGDYEKKIRTIDELEKASEGVVKL